MYQQVCRNQSIRTVSKSMATAQNVVFNSMNKSDHRYPSPTFIMLLQIFFTRGIYSITNKARGNEIHYVQAILNAMLAPNLANESCE